MKRPTVGRRNFIKAAGVSAAALGATRGFAMPPGESAGALAETRAESPAESKFPQLAIITRYSPAKLRFAAETGYEGVVIASDDSFDPDKLTDSQIDQILAAARDAGIRIISIECMWGYNHIARDPAERKEARAKFVRALELSHRLGCKFTGTFTGGNQGASVDDQVKALAEAINEQYLPVCEKLDMRFGPENYPCPENFATVPGVWEKLFALVPNKRFGLEFDPSHFVRQFIDPIQVAWEFSDRIHAVHLKDTEITEPVLQKVGIHGQGWWRYRIPGQGLIAWPKFFTVLLQVGFKGGMAVEHEDEFWDGPDGDDQPDFPQARKDGFILAHRFLSMYLPGRLG
jgi:sugar phosphate isomerase/epimerase